MGTRKPDADRFGVGGAKTVTADCLAGCWINASDMASSEKLF
jgi:hypothetical protein